jgi:ABC-type lipopolysaccharide export system ATPase subunit
MYNPFSKFIKLVSLSGMTQNSISAKAALMLNGGNNARLGLGYLRSEPALMQSLTIILSILLVNAFSRQPFYRFSVYPRMTNLHQ